MEHRLQLSRIEKQMIDEVFEVMNKYSNATRKFAVHLSHSHFSIKKNEVLYETHDKINRILTITPKRIRVKGHNSLATAWKKENGKLEIEMFCCDGGDTGGITIPPPSEL